MRVANIRKSWPFSWPATFQKKWPVSPRRCLMSAKADVAAAALRELGATLKASTNAPKLHTLKLLHELGLNEEEDKLELSMMEELATLVRNADGPAGDKVKYEHAVGPLAHALAGGLAPPGQGDTRQAPQAGEWLSLIHISEPTRPY